MGLKKVAVLFIVLVLIPLILEFYNTIVKPILEFVFNCFKQMNFIVINSYVKFINQYFGQNATVIYNNNKT